VLLACSSAPLVFAGTTGKLSGTVMNDKKEPLAGPTSGSKDSDGAASDRERQLLIIGIPAGEYIVRVESAGAPPYVANKVTIAPTSPPR
jgi:hypothetical protein